MTDVSDAIEAARVRPAGRTLGRFALLLFFAGILVVLGWLGWKAWRLYQTGSSLLARQAQIEELATVGWREADPEVVEALVLGLRADVLALKQDFGFVLPYVGRLSRLPAVGSLAAATPHLFEMADAGTEAAAFGFRTLKPVLTAVQSREGNEPLLPVLLETVEMGQPDLAKASLALDRVAAARSQITDLDALPWRVKNLLEMSDEWLATGQELLRISPFLPELMGLNGPRRYLVLAQNEDELRATGGFISGAGYLEVENGEITALDFIDANLVDAWEQDDWTGGRLAKPYSEPPPPLKDFMLLDLFLFRDANFWPDFAVSAQKAMDLYAYGRDLPPLDGAIGIDQQFLQLLLEGMGQVTLTETGEVVDSSNVIETLQGAWTLQDGVHERKAFMGPFAEAILRRLVEGFAEVDPLHFTRQLSQTLDQKDLQIYMREPRVAAALAANNWDGRLPAPANHDVLMIVDSNMGYNKANYFVDRVATYDVRLSGEGESAASLAVTHTHRGEPGEEACWQGTTEEYFEGASYPALTDKCYWNYLRIYAPEGSRLISGPDHLIPGTTWFGGYDWQPGPETSSELPGYTTFSSWMLLPRGEELTSEFEYSLPDSVVQAADGAQLYSLRLIKQAGVRPHMVQVRITPPDGRAVVAAVPDPVAVEGDTYIFAVELDKDQTVAVAYR